MKYLLNYKQMLLVIGSFFLVACAAAPTKSNQTNSADTKSNQTNSADTKSNQTYSADTPMPEGRELVIEVQEMLASRNHNPGPVDGLIGAKTISALKSFQSDNGIPPTGRIDEITYNALKGEDKPEGKGNLEFAGVFEKLGAQIAGALDEAGTKPPTASGQTRNPTTSSQTTSTTTSVQTSSPTSTTKTTEDGERSMAGLEPIGPVNKPGCKGIEVIGYAEDKIATGDSIYYVAIRNNTSITKLVSVKYIGGKRMSRPPLSGQVTLNVKGGQVKTWDIDLASSAPALVEITKCL